MPVDPAMVALNIYDYLLIIFYYFGLLFILIYTWFLSSVRKYLLISWEKNKKIFLYFIYISVCLVILRIVLLPVTFIKAWDTAYFFISIVHAGLLFGSLVPTTIIDEFVRSIHKNQEKPTKECVKVLINGIISGNFVFIAFLVIFLINFYADFADLLTLRYVVPLHDLLILIISSILLPIISSIRVYPLISLSNMFSTDAKYKITEYLKSLGVITKDLLTNRYRNLRLLAPISNANEIIQQPFTFLDISPKNKIFTTETMIIDCTALSARLTKRLVNTKTDRERIGQIVNLLFQIIDEAGIKDARDVRVLLIAMLKSQGL
ncbi:MAG: hypothetical protein ACTSVW_05795 [Candidatus Njordarchaeales archaeon]